MSGRRKHRVLVEVTFEKNVTAKVARDVVKDCVNLEYLNDFYDIPRKAPDVIAYRVKEAERVIQAELRWRGKTPASVVPSTD